MPKMSQAFPTKYLSAGDLDGKEITLKIASCKIEDMGDETKPVIFFEGKKKGLVLNRTNAGVLTQAFDSDDSDNWIGKEIVVYPTTTQFMSKIVPCLRVRVPMPDMGVQDEPPF